MLAERREEARRFEISKPIVLVNSNGEKCLDGMTSNMSDAGVRVRFASGKGNPVPGSSIRLQLAWDADSAPSEQWGRVMWTAPCETDASFEVGVRILDIPAAIDDLNSASVEAVPTCRIEVPGDVAAACVPELEHGSHVMVSLGGKSLEAIVYRIGDIDGDGEISLRLQVVDNAFSIEIEAPSLVEVEETDWTPHPFRDMYQTARTYAGPLLSLAKKGAVRSVFAALFLWNRLPQRHRDKLLTVGLHAWNSKVVSRCRMFVASVSIRTASLMPKR